MMAPVAYCACIMGVMAATVALFVALRLCCASEPSSVPAQKGVSNSKDEV